MADILVCDDDKAIVKSIEFYLQSEGFSVFPAYNGKEAVELCREHEFQCIIMDVMMPVMDGIVATIAIRKESAVPIIFLSAKSEDTDKIAGLGFGADDYVTKPFNPLELIARVKSQIRRYTSYGAESSNRDSVISTGGLSIDLKTRQLTLNGENIRLTATEFKIMEYLMLNLGCTLSSSQIYEEVWGEKAISSDNTITVHIRRIREKIEVDTKNPIYLKVVWGLGYKIEKI